MHYFIDGYNLLFRLLHGGGDLQSRREAVILDLNQKVSLVNLDVSIVFDAPFQIGEGARTHFDRVEILFTAEGETADEYIVDELKHHPHPQHETVVTSDKKLAWQVRCRLAHTESVEDFMLWLNRAYKNKIRELKQGKVRKEQPKALVKPRTKAPSLPSGEAPLQAWDGYYEQVFEKGWQEIQAKEQVLEKMLSQQDQKRPPRRPKPKRDPFSELQSPEEKASSEMERWQKIFEERSKKK